MVKKKPLKAKAKTRDLVKLKKALLEAYCELKRNHKKEVVLFEFLKRSKFKRSEIYKVYRKYSTFQNEAEDLFISKLPTNQRALLSERSKKFEENVTIENCIDDLRLIQEVDPLKHITRNFYREHGKYSDSTWHQHFGTFQEFRRQAGLELTRHQHKLEKDLAKHAAHDHYKKYYQDKVLPYYRKYEKKNTPGHIKKIMVITDLHDEEADRFTLSTFIAECKRKQPDIILLGGDIFDLYEFSRYTQDPRKFDILGRFKFVWNNVFKPLRDACPKSQMDLICGNHELRLIKLLADAVPSVRILLSDVMGLEFKDVFKLDEYKINFISKFDLGAFTAKDAHNELKKNYQIYYGCWVFAHEPDKNLAVMSGANGHHHRLSVVSDAYIDNHSGEPRQVTWVQTPAGHVKNAEYLHNLAKWNTGFLEVTINLKTKDAIQHVHQTHDWTVIDGVYYERREEDL